MDKKIRIQNVKTGVVFFKTETAVKIMKKHGLFDDFQVIPDLIPTPIVEQPIVQEETQTELTPVKRGRKPKEVQEVQNEQTEEQ
jgi:hypothetical protein